VHLAQLRSSSCSQLCRSLIGVFAFVAEQERCCQAIVEDRANGEAVLRVVPLFGDDRVRDLRELVLRRPATSVCALGTDDGRIGGEIGQTRHDWPGPSRTRSGPRGIRACAETLLIVRNRLPPVAAPMAVPRVRKCAEMG